ncbi:(2Fe-2S)-binding protein [Chachezhania antarctica]|uniref:(2Fe-2S)-binding protein n=1 Tax=Chachezhania antarctica TaxID=2340860 RepID=UPI000EB15C3C|nr:(2Fe-2S)-binding protein [Chachezhania antarctica]|tara:strand:+ start:9731 stop:10258 length:528 start_codon:yes stop_codon:yes gene_type:complete
MIPTTTISMTVNGAPVGPHEVPDTLPMIDYLNDHLGLTGTKFGCGLGICHACVVIVERGDGTRDTERTCINGAASFDGLKITTVEGHADGATLSDVQQAFVDHFAFQCGYCTPGFVNEATLMIETLKQAPIPKNEIEATIETALGEHICRCSGYVRYYEAMRALIEQDPRLTKES